MKRPVSGILIYLLNCYRVYISPQKRTCCKYTPSCSQYAIEAITLHGVFIGGLYAVWRILRCNPFSKGGYDPVPLRNTYRKAVLTDLANAASEREST